MSKYAAFMAGNVQKIDNKKVKVSKRFPEFEIRALSANENDELQKRSMVNVAVVGQKGVYNRELDQFKYTALMIAESVVFPALDDAELQDSYNVKTPEDLIRAMLTMNEYNVLAQAITDLNKGESFDELVAQAKN